MAILQVGNVFQNILTMVILLAVFYFMYKSMRETKMKRIIQDGIAKLKMEKDK